MLLDDAARRRCSVPLREAREIEPAVFEPARVRVSCD
jgi:hypothetical protein